MGDRRPVLTVNGGSSSLKLALFDVGPPLTRLAQGSLSGAGRPIAIGALMDWIDQHAGPLGLAAVGHRVVHGGPDHYEPQAINAELLSALRGLCPVDPEHLPQQIQWIEALQRRFPGLAQVACFDTAFHRHLPRVAQQLAIPRRYEALGLRRFGFHGLSYQFLLEELARVAGPSAAQGRVILAHLGSGASLAAVKEGRSQDTSMGFSPAGGIPMGTRSGDLDPGIVAYLAQTEGMDARTFNAMVHERSGLLGVSGSSADMGVLLGLEAHDLRAAEAVALFCYQAKKWVGAYAAVLGGLDCLVFSGGIGERAPLVRERICQGLEFLGVELDRGANLKGEGVISAAGSRVSVRVMPTDEELLLARLTCHALGLGQAWSSPADIHRRGTLP